MQYNNMVGLGAPAAHGQRMYSPHQSYNTIGGGGVIGVGGDVGGGVGPFFQPGAAANKYCSSTAANDILLATTPAGGPCLQQDSGSGLLVAPHPGSCLTSSLAAQVESCHAVPPAGSTSFLAMHAGLGDAPRFNGTSTNCGAGPGACAPLSARVFADGPHDLGFRLTGTSGPAHGGLGAGSSAASPPPSSPPGYLLHQFGGPGGGSRDVVSHGSGHLLGPSAFQWSDIPILDDSDAVAAAAAAAAATIQDCWALNFPGDVDYGQPSRHVTMPAVCMYPGPSQTGVGNSLQVNKSINNNNAGGSSSSSSNTSANLAESRLIACRGHNVSNIQAVRGNVMSAASQTGNSPRSVLPLDSSSSASAAAAAASVGGPGAGSGLGVHSAMHSEQDKCVYRQAETCANSHLSHRAQSDRRFCADADAKPVPVAIGDVDVDLTRSAAFVVQDDLESVASDAGGSKFRQHPSSLSLSALPLANGPHPGVTNVNAATANVAAVLPYLSPTSQHGGPAPPNSHMYAAGGASLGAGPGDDSWSMRSSNSSSSSRPLGGSPCHWVPSCAAPAGNMSTNASANAVQAVVQAGDACPWQAPCKSSAPPQELPTNSRVSASVANDIHNYRKRLGDESMDLASKRMKDVTTPNVKANDLPVINTGVPTRSCNPMPSASIPSSSASASNVNHKSLGPALNTNLKPRARQGSANDPQSIAARHRRERISERLKVLQDLVPNGSKVDLVTMLEKAISYVKSLQVQVKFLTADEYWPDSSKASTSSPHVDALANDGSLPLTGIGCTSITNSLATCVKSELNPNSEPLEMPSIADTFVLEQGSELDSSI